MQTGLSFQGSGFGLKGVPTHLIGKPFSAIGKAGLSLLDDELMLPAAILKKSVLRDNSAWMRAFLMDQGVEIAPHGKTTMCPELFAMQLRDGAWGMTAATAHHVRLYAELGIRKIIMANQLIGAANIAAVLDVLRNYPETEFYCLVDDVAGVSQLADAVAAAGIPSPVRVLVELGAAGERAGVRSVEAALQVALACSARASQICLSGVECFEGVFAPVEAPVGPVMRLLDTMIEAARALDAAGLFTSEEIMVTAGGSAFFDLAASAIKRVGLTRPMRLIIRSGCYLTHDSRLYEESFERILDRQPHLRSTGRFQSALEVWAHVQSRPEPMRAIAALGKRDVSNDVHRPEPLWIFRKGRDAAPVSCPAEVKVASLYDQHACLDLPADLDLAIGDLIGFGVSHPCTTFDKWKALFIVDDDYKVVDVFATCF